MLGRSNKHIKDMVEEGRLKGQKEGDDEGKKEPT